MVDIKIPATDSHHRFSQRIWCFEPSQVLTGFYSSVFQTVRWFAAWNLGQEQWRLKDLEGDNFFFCLEKWRLILHVIACYTGQTMINPRFTKIFERVGTKVDLHGNPEWVATEGCGGCSTFWSFPSPNHTESFRILSPTSFARMFFWTPCWELIAFACHPDFLWKSPSIFTYFHTIAVQLYNYRYSLYQHDWGAHHRIWPWLSHLTIWQVLLKIRLVVPSTRY